MVFHNGLFVSFPISPKGPEKTFPRLFLVECVGPGDLGTAGNFFNESQAHCNVPPEDWVNVGASTR